MKLYKVTGIAKSDQGTARYHAHSLAAGISTRHAADRILEALASQGASRLDVQGYEVDDGGEAMADAS